MKQNEGSGQPSTANGDIDAARQAGRVVSPSPIVNRLTGQNNHPASDAQATLTEARYPLLRRLSITSLLATLITATLLILLYRQDQLDEHEGIAAQENEKTAIHLIQLMSGQLEAYLAAAAGLDIHALRSNPGIDALNATLNTVREHHILKLKLYDASGMVVFSTVDGDIGGASRNRGIPQKAMTSGTQHQLEFRDALRISSGEIRDRQILATYVPLTRAEKRIGVLAVYSDITPAFDRVRAKTTDIALIVFGIFAALYAALFLSARRVDRALSGWQQAVADNHRKLAENEARLWTTVNSALDAVISIDANSRLIGFNPAAEDMFGWKKAEIIGQSMTELLIPERHRSSHQDGIARYLQTGETRTLSRRIEITALRRDGMEFPIELTITPIRESNRTIFTAYIRDITERKRVETAQQEALHRLQLISSQVPGLVYQFCLRPDGSYCLPFASNAIREIFRLAPDEVRNDASKIFIAIHPDDRDGTLASIQTSAQGMTPWHHEFRVKFDDGTVRWLQGDSQPQREADGSILWHGFVTDITERKQAEEELRESRAFHLSVTEAMGEIGIGLFIVDAGYRVRYMNNVMKEWFGDQTGEVCHSSLCDLTDRCEHCQLEQVISGNGAARYTPTASDGRTFDIIATPIQNRDGTVSKLEVVRDVTQHRLAEQELRIAATAFDSQEGMFITDADGIIQRVNNAFIETTGYSAEEAVGKTPAILKSGKHDAAFYRAIREALESDGHWQGEIWNRRKNGEIYPEWETISVVRGTNGQITHYVSVFTDISLRKRSEEQIRTLAFYDPLTQLPNRRLLLDRLHQALALSVRNERQGALLFIDLDNFKSINDTQGHATGDLLLVEAAKRLQDCIREGDTTARLGGDEFVVLLEDLDADEQVAASQAETVGEKILSAIGKPYLINGHEHHSTASIGITLFRGSVKTMDEMLKRADVALYQAKADGRNILRFFDPAMQAAVAARVSLESDLRRAILEQEQLQLYYQAQVNSSGRLTGAEALVRWRHPERGMVSPAEFIPLAEESGLILPLGHWVMATACQQLATWATEPDTAHLTLAVNVSAKQFHLPTFVEEVATLVDYFGVNPARLKLEITESLMVENVDDIIAKMSELKTRGINFSMDDFGTGYSSLSYLKHLPLYQLKIDQSFVRDVLTDPNDAAIAKIIVSLAQSMNLMVIAEGVETEEQREFLEQNGCHAFQGYLFSKPVPVGEFEQLIPQYT
ncbi:EAL domain-containing protein [Candidatus Ferrigenium straubiae]|uniref:EAL domain-containing protein n=1 Tax=Candidatus Ferrigenium straubiae TaxID=2919506 RepID=UPI003F4AE3F5